MEYKDRRGMHKKENSFTNKDSIDFIQNFILMTKDIDIKRIIIAY